MCVYTVYTVHVCMCVLLVVCTHVCIGCCMCIWYAHMECACIVCSDACVHFMLPAVSVHTCHCVVNVHMVCSWGVCVCGTRVHIYVVMCVYMCVVYVCMICSHTVWGCVCV